jgi:hypothetical protein
MYERCGLLGCGGEGRAFAVPPVFDIVDMERETQAAAYLR